MSDSVIINTPVVTLQWPQVDVPDFSGEHSNKEFGTYSFQILLDPEIDTHRTFIETYNDLHTELTNKAEKGRDDVIGRRPTPIKPVKSKGEETGKYRLGFSKTAQYKDRKTGKIKENRFKFVDRTGTPLSKEEIEKLGAGTTVKLRLALSPYVQGGVAGCSRKVYTALVVNYVQAGGSDVSDLLEGLEDYDLYTVSGTQSSESESVSESVDVDELVDF